MKHWACLHNEKDAEDIHAGADGLLVQLTTLVEVDRLLISTGLFA
jgi:hypothetical protein